MTGKGMGNPRGSTHLLPIYTNANVFIVFVFLHSEHDRRYVEISKNGVYETDLLSLWPNDVFIVK